MATSSPTTADIKVAVGDRMTDILRTGLVPEAYTEFCRLVDVLDLLEAEYHPPKPQPTPVVATPTPSQNGHVKTYGGTPTVRERIRAYLKGHGPSRVVDILRGAGVKQGSISGILNSASTEFVSPSRGVWKLKNDK